ncbi:Glutathione gamma-glutamylcysteinyltransferase [Durusdinium trenchii]|uniref:Glutathione gamma-glutamylcysteinyltransferase n=1 Tax=Durusdinium trenchii TaxID=1381693 RepID=A0ABP0NHX9_9DINO
MAHRLQEALGASTAQPLFLEDPTDRTGRRSEPLTTALKSALGTEGKGLLFVDGGNTFWPLILRKRSGLGEALRELRSLSPFAYVGISAGAILAGKTCDTAYWKGWDDPTVVPGDAAQETLDARWDRPSGRVPDAGHVSSEQVTHGIRPTRTHRGMRPGYP